MTIKKFIALSFFVHAVAGFCIYLVPVSEVKKTREFTTKLVSPEELKKPAIKRPDKVIRPLIPIPPPVARIKPAPKPPRVEKRVPQFPPLSSRPRIPEDAKPLVPGEGSETGKPLPEDQITRQGRGDEGEGTGRRTIEGEDEGKKSVSRSKSPDKPGYSDRKKLFDRGTINEIARKDIAGKTKRDDAVTFNTEDYRYAGYMGLLRARIEGSGCWVYPSEAAARSIHGDLLVRFTIMKNGSLGEVELVRTSGHKMLDDAAMRALRDCGPYWPLPDAWEKDSHSILGHFVYSLYGVYVR